MPRGEPAILVAVLVVDMLIVCAKVVAWAVAAVAADIVDTVLMLLEVMVS